MKYIYNILLIIFVGCLIVLFVLSPLLFYSFPYLSSQYLGQFSSLFTTNELSHLQDVASIFTTISMIEIVSLSGFAIIFMLFVYLKFKKKIVLWFLRWSAISLLLILSIIIAIFIDFQSLFLSFHYVFFPQGNRSFDWSSVLIQLFPASFFEHIAIQSFVISIILSFGILLLTFYFRKKASNRGF